MESPPTRVRVEAGKPQVVEMLVDATGAGKASLAVRALIAGGESDGEERTFPILAHGRPVLATRAGEGDGAFEIALPGARTRRRVCSG